MDLWLSWGLDLARALQSLGSWLTAPMQLFSLLGTEEFYMLLLPFVFWCVSRALGIELLTLLLISAGLNEWVKGLLKLPRPFWLDPKLGLSVETSYGLPSGHAQNAVVLWGYLAVVGRGLWRWLWLALIVLISFSRLYLGVHFPGDVLVGWTLGLLVLGGFIWLKPKLASRLRVWSVRTHVLAAVVVSAVILVLYMGAAAIPSGDPLRYGAFFSVAHARIYEAAGTVVGMILGAWIGLAIEERHIRFDPSGPLRQRAVRLLVGMVVLIAIRFGLKALFPEDPLAIGLAFRVLRYALMMAWVTLGWPWLFVRFGWARR